MYIEQLRLKDFRRVKDLTIPLDRRLNVFVGLNGSGKSTMLDASAILLSWLVNRIKSSTGSGRAITEHDIRNDADYSSLELQLRPEEVRGDYHRWRLTKQRKWAGPKDFDKSILSGASSLARIYRDRLEENHGDYDIPLFAYYPVNRAVTDIPLRIRQRHKFDILSAYEESLTSGANFRTFFEWFREREDIENEALRDSQGANLKANPDLPDSLLNAVRQALTQFMPDFSDFAVRRSPLRMEVKKHGETLIVNQLSDGEKCLMAMIGDLARRLAIANPTLKNPLEGHGIILIDEIDLHLHPKWQRDIVPRLRDHFPNCQFLISTHSPHVITHVRPENLHLLKYTKEGLEASRPGESYGKNVDRVLEDLMELSTTRPDKIQGELDRIFDLIRDNNMDEAKAAIQCLKEEIGEDPALVKASVLIRRKGLLDK